MATEAERKKIKAERMLAKAMRMPLNEVVLQVQKGTIDIKDVFKKIEQRVKEVANG